VEKKTAAQISKRIAKKGRVTRCQTTTEKGDHQAESLPGKTLSIILSEVNFRKGMRKFGELCAKRSVLRSIPLGSFKWGVKEKGDGRMGQKGNQFNRTNSKEGRLLRRKAVDLSA